MKKTHRSAAFAALMALVLLLSPSALLCSAAPAGSTVADWHFEQAGVQSGSIEKNNLVLKDFSGNGNLLELRGSNAKKHVSFSDQTMYSGTGGSLKLDSQGAAYQLKNGSYFMTDKKAPVNQETFSSGYTIEMIYQLPDDFTTRDSWMGLLSRKGKSHSMTETRGCSTSLAVSNCKELQFLTANEKDSHEMDSAWSISMDKGGAWYHIAIVSDGKAIRTYINGCESFRDYISEEMQGMYASPKDGRFCIGAFGNGLFDHFARGSFQQVRISSRPLERAQWLIPNPEKLIGEYGTNQPFTINGGGNYNMVFLPDIQNSVEFKNEVVVKAVDWLIQNQETANIASIISLGDNVNTYQDTTQWNKALASLQKIAESKIPFIEQPGNHDYGDTYYLDTFGKNSAFGKTMAENQVVYADSGYSSYRIFEAGSYRYLMVALSMEQIENEDRAEMHWFEQVLKDHPNLPTIVTTHDMQICDNARPDRVQLSENGQKVWAIAQNYDQVFLLLGGHNHGSGTQTLKNQAGHPVYSVLADYQFAYNGGNGFFKFAEFDEAHNQIRISTFSPYAYTLKEEERTFFDVNFMTGAGNYTVLDLDFSARFPQATPSGSAAQQQQLIALVRGIDALKEGVTLADKENILNLNRQFQALPASTQADFNNRDTLEDAVRLLADLENKPEGTKATPVNTWKLPEASAPSTAENADAGKASPAPLLYVLIAAGVLLVVLAIVIPVVLILKKRRKSS